MIAVYIIFGWLIAGMVAYIAFYFRKSSRMTSSTTGEVISATEQEIRDVRGRRDITVVRCRYHTQEKDWEIEYTFSGKRAAHYPAGRPVPIRYNPMNPASAMISVR